MKFYERYELLCAEAGYKPQSKEMLDMAQVSSPAVIRWREGASPRTDIAVRIANYFNVSVDYLLGVSDYRSSHELTEEEWMMIDAYRSIKSAKEKEAV